MAHSSSGLGHLPLKEEITGSNPVCATKHLKIHDFEAKIKFSRVFSEGVSTNSLQIALLNNFPYCPNMVR